MLRLLAEGTEVVTIATDWEDSRSIDAAAATVEAMRDGAPIIAQAVLRDPQHRTYGMADLLVRSDVLAELFPADLGAEAASVAAPGLWLPDRHYRVVDIKMRALDLRADGSVGRTADTLAYQAQVWAYNTALGRIQGYTPPAGYLLGRNWKRGRQRGNGCLDRLGRIDMDNTFDRHDGESLTSLTLRAHAWIREVRRGCRVGGVAGTHAAGAVPAHGQRVRRSLARGQGQARGGAAGADAAAGRRPRAATGRARARADTLDGPCRIGSIARPRGDRGADVHGRAGCEPGARAGDAARTPGSWRTTRGASWRHWSCTSTSRRSRAWPMTSRRCRWRAGCRSSSRSAAVGSRMGRGASTSGRWSG